MLLLPARPQPISRPSHPLSWLPTPPSSPPSPPFRRPFIPPSDSSSPLLAPSLHPSSSRSPIDCSSSTPRLASSRPCAKRVHGPSVKKLRSTISTELVVCWLSSAGSVRVSSSPSILVYSCNISPRPPKDPRLYLYLPLSPLPPPPPPPPLPLLIPSDSRLLRCHGGLPSLKSVEESVSHLHPLPPSCILHHLHPISPSSSFPAPIFGVGLISARPWPFMPSNYISVKMMSRVVSPVIGRLIDRSI